MQDADEFAKAVLDAVNDRRRALNLPPVPQYVPAPQAAPYAEAPQSASASAYYGAQQTAYPAQQYAASGAACPPVADHSVADELKRYKELFDGGVITEEEFNAKKKQLLGL